MTDRQRAPWAPGRAVVDKLLSERALERVPVNHAHAESLIEQARVHIQSARTIAATDPVSAYTLAYDATRKALVAILAAEGLRSTTDGGHIAPGDAVVAQFPTPFMSMRSMFNRMRRTRHLAEYPSPDTIPVTVDEAFEAADDAVAFVDASVKILPIIPKY